MCRSLDLLCSSLKHSVAAAALLAACFVTAGAEPQLAGPQRTAVSGTGSNASTVDLCQGLVTDHRPRAVEPLAKQPVGQEFRDPAFGTRIRRLTDSRPGAIVTPMYSAVQAWNADESLLILYHTDGSHSGHSLYDGKTYRYIRELDIRPADIEQVYWDTRDANILYYVDNYIGGERRGLVRYHVDSDRREVRHYFSCLGSVVADSHGFTSWDSKVLALACHGEAKDQYAFVYDLGDDREGPHQPLRFETAPLTAPSGLLFYWHGSVLDSQLRELRKLDLENPTEHASLGRLLNGHDTYNEAAYDGANEGSLVSHDMTDGSTRVIVGPRAGFPYPPKGSHMSAVAIAHPGWVAVSSIGSPPRLNGFLDQEIYLANTDPSRPEFCRVAHHRSWGDEGHMGYWAEPHVVISPSGTRLLFGSDWGGGPSVDAYVIELPAYEPPGMTTAGLKQ
jgi:hypothetical protein